MGAEPASEVSASVVSNFELLLDEEKRKPPCSREVATGRLYRLTNPSRLSGWGSL